MKKLNFTYPSFLIGIDDTFTLSVMKELDRYIIDKLHIPVEVMMENAGHHLARIVSKLIIKKDKKLLIGIGPGNNGGGGLVAARRLAGWGYNVYLDIPVEIKSEVSKVQKKRAGNVGCKFENINDPDLFIDCYFGFSQRHPLQEVFTERINKINATGCIKVALDIPTGMTEGNFNNYIKPDYIVTLAAPKKMLFQNGLKSDIYLIDIGIPKEVLNKFGFELSIPFEKSQVYKIEINKEKE